MPRGNMRKRYLAREFMLSFISSFSAWNWLDILGLSMVTIGVLGELVLRFKKFPYNPTNFPPLETCKKFWEVSFEALLLFGLGLELIALPISLYESQIEIAGLKKQTEQLHKENLVLELKIQDRTITPENVKDFIELTKGLTNKIYIKVIVSLEDGETERYARQIRNMLDVAGFGTNGEGIVRVSPRFVIENTNSIAKFSAFAVAFECYGKNDMPIFLPISFPPNSDRPVTSSGFPNDIRVFAYVGWAFSKIGLPPAYLSDDVILKPGEFAVFVPQKIH